MIKNRFAQLYIRAAILAAMVIGTVLSLGALEPAPNFYVYFTNLSIYLCLGVEFAQLMFTIRKIARDDDTSDDVHPLIKFIALIGITLTCIVYNTMLSNPLKAEYWYDFNGLWLHLVIPVLFWFDWIFMATHRNTKWYYPLAATIFPLVYLAFIVIRAQVIGANAPAWQVVYPYFFLDVNEIGSTKVVMWILILFVAVCAFGYIVYLLDNILNFRDAYKFRKENPEAYAEEKLAKQEAKAALKAQKEEERLARKQAKEAARAQAEAEETEEVEEDATTQNVTNINIVIDRKSGKSKVVTEDAETEAVAEETETELSEEEQQRLADKEARRAAKEARKAEKAAAKQAKKEAKERAKAEKLAAAEAENAENGETGETENVEELSEEEQQRLADKEAKRAAKEARKAEKAAAKQAKKEAKERAKAEKLAAAEAAETTEASETATETTEELSEEEQQRLAIKEARRIEKETVKAEKAAAKQAKKEAKERAKAEKKAQKEAERAAREAEQNAETSTEQTAENPNTINIQTEGGEVNITINHDDNK